MRLFGRKQASSAPCPYILWYGPLRRVPVNIIFAAENVRGDTIHNEIAEFQDTAHVCTPVGTDESGKICTARIMMTIDVPQFITLGFIGLNAGVNPFS
jgi:hypothetical protein